MKWLKSLLVLCLVTVSMAASRCNPDVPTDTNYVMPSATQDISPLLQPKAPSRSGAYYTVKRGDTLSQIARANGLTVNDIKAANPKITNPNLIEPGNLLYLPGVKGENVYPSSAGQTIPSATPGVASSQGYIKPVNGYVKSSYGVWLSDCGRRNDGVIFGAPLGSPVMAARSGKVFLVSPGLVSYGKVVMIDHGNNIWTMYSHLNDVYAKPGQAVRAGQVIATVGQTGRISAPALHFAIANKGKFVDPAFYLPK